MSINIVQGDILKADVDAIVNPANGHLRHGGGLAAVIARAAMAFPKGFLPPASLNAREELFEERDRYAREAHEWFLEQENHPLIATGNAGWTSAGRLPFKGIVHAVGPIWNGGAYYEHSLLKSAHLRALRVAADNGCTSVAFPAISCGIFGFPVEVAAPVAVQAVAEWLSLQKEDKLNVERVAFYLFEDAHFEAYNNALEAVA